MHNCTRRASTDLEPSPFKKYFGFQGGVSERESGFKPAPLHIAKQFHDETIQCLPAAAVSWQRSRDARGGVT
jgi:hypothetical protein